MFQRLAERILTSPDGNFKPSPLPQLLDELTYEDIAVAVDVVEAVVTKQQPRPSGRAQFRLLAWTVADARGAAAPLDRAVAEAVGKRLDRQAKRVRDAMKAVSAGARELRLQLSGGMADPATLKEGIAAVDVEERSRLEALRAEVYVGFHELNALLPDAEEEAEKDPEHPVLAAALQTAEVQLKRQSAPASLPAIPPDLARRIGPEGVQYIWDHALDNKIYPRRSEDWHIHLPYMIQNLILELVKRPSEESADAHLARIEEIIQLRKELIEAKTFIIKQDAYVASLEARLGIPPLET